MMALANAFSFSKASFLDARPAVLDGTVCRALARRSLV
jgi:hypothetical protein